MIVRAGDDADGKAVESCVTSQCAGREVVV